MNMENQNGLPLDILAQITEALGLGVWTAPPTALNGGLTHKMISLSTSGGRYAVKLLNPYIMWRPTALQNFETAEKLETVLEQASLPILPALAFCGKKMQQIKEQYYYVFPWFDGKPVRGSGITPYHCAEMGKALAGIHKIHPLHAPYMRDEIRIDWDFYLARLETENPALYRLLSPSRTLLYQSQQLQGQAVQALPELLTICHNDMDPKNVLWNGKEYRIIDLECLSYASPVLELLETALCWSGFDNGKLDTGLLRAFIQAYRDHGGVGQADWESVYNSNFGSLEWLEYNLKRALGIDSGADEKETGISEVKSTLSRILFYHQSKKEILDCFAQI